MESFAAVPRSSVPPEAILRIYQWKYMTGEWDLVYSTQSTPEENFAERRRLEENRLSSTTMIRQTPIIDLTGDNDIQTIKNDQILVIGGVLCAHSDNRKLPVDWEPVQKGNSSTAKVDANSSNAGARTTKVDAESNVVKKLKETTSGHGVVLREAPKEIQCSCGKMITDNIITCPHCRLINTKAKDYSQAMVKRHMVNVWVSRNAANLSNNPDQAQQLAIVADQVGLQASDLLVVGVDQPKRMRGLHLNNSDRALRAV